jgi:transcriptional regulator with XRE-family HTH domain
MIKEEEVGKRIKNIRLNAGLKLNELAEKTGISQGYLSKIENSKNAPPVSTLLMIARALKVGISEIFGEHENQKPISFIRKKDRPFVARNGSIFGYSYQALAHKFQNKHFDPYILIIPGDLTRETDFHFEHKGQEMLFVIKGKMRFLYNEEEYILDEGDCVFFDSSLPHNGFSRDNNEVECLIAIFTPDQ